MATTPPIAAGPQDQIEVLADEWDRLADRVGGPPFLRPGWFSVWWRAFGSGQLVLLTIRREGELAGVLPLARRRGALEALANYHTPAFGLLAEHPGVAEGLIREALAQRPRRLSLDLLDVAQTDVGVAARAAGENGYRQLTRTQQRTPAVEISGDWERFRAGLGRSFRKELGRQRRRLAERGEVTFDVDRGGERLDERLREAFTVEGSGWKSEGGTAIASRPETRTFYEGIAQWAAGRGMLRLCFLRLDGVPIAVDYALEDSGVRFILKGGFEVEYARQSPGSLLLESGLEDAFAAGLGRVELGGGEDAYKLRWTEAVRERRLLQAFAPSLLGRADHALVTVGRPIAKRLLDRRRREPR
jgi:CelD/BcsL family acetyltransferase involved in cellulose biosynthesis